MEVEIKTLKLKKIAGIKDDPLFAKSISVITVDLIRLNVQNNR